MNRHVLVSVIVAILFVISGIVALQHNDALMAGISGVAAALFALRALQLAKKSNQP